MSEDDSIKKETSSRRKVAMWRLMELAEPEYPLIAVSLAGLAVNAATNISFPHILGRAVDHFSTSKRDDKFLYLAGSVFAIGSTASWIRVYYMGIATERIATRLRKMLFDSFMEKDVAFFDSSKTGELVTILEDDVDAAAEALTVNLASGLRSLNSSVNGSIMLLLRSATLTCVSLSVVPIIGVGAMGMRSLVKKHREKLREMQGDVLNFAIERFTSMSTVKLNGREETEMRRFERFSDRGLVLAKKMHFLDGATMSFISAGMNVGLLAVLFKGGQLIGSGSMSAGDLTQFALQSGFVGLGFSGLSRVWTDLTKSLDAADRVFAAIDAHTDARAVLLAPPRSTAPASWAPTRGQLTLTNLSFAYPSRPQDLVIEKLSLHTTAGTFVAVTGPSGAGKSTLLNIISGLHAPQEGSIMLDGVDIGANRVSREDLHRAVGVVEQSANLMSGSIHDAIAYGGGPDWDCDYDYSQQDTPCLTDMVMDKDDAEAARLEEMQRRRAAQREMVVEASKLAAAHQFISALPEGYDTQVGARGTMLSGGQQARVAIARALVKRPRLLILDEASAGLDPAAEGELLDILRKLVKGTGSFSCSVLFFTHSQRVTNVADKVERLSPTTHSLVEREERVRMERSPSPLVEA